MMTETEKLKEGINQLGLILSEIQEETEEEETEEEEIKEPVKEEPLTKLEKKEDLKQKEIAELTAKLEEIKKKK